MPMHTRCPHCDTVFRVTPQQLQKQHGQVRCGRCMQVFDGFHTLSSELDRSVAEPVALAEVAAPAAPAAAKPQAPLPEPAVAATAASASAPAGGGLFAPEPADGAEDEALEDATRPRRRSYAWAVGAVLLALVLGAQAAYVYRVQLAASFPALKPALVVACGALDCTVPLPQQPRLISIEASDLQVPDASRPGVIQLTATLRSHAHYDLAYPALDLVLTNAQDHTLARRVFIPRDYLERGRDPAAGIPPNAEVTLRLDLDTGDLGASGFRLDLLPAPS